VRLPHPSRSLKGGRIGSSHSNNFHSPTVTSDRVQQPIGCATVRTHLLRATCVCLLRRSRIRRKPAQGRVGGRARPWPHNADAERQRQGRAGRGKKQAGGRPRNDLHYDHPILLLQHTIWHEAYHHGQIKLALVLAGRPITNKEAGPLTWGIWMRKNSHVRADAACPEQRRRVRPASKSEHPLAGGHSSRPSA
jgi:hypothetical protein